MVVRSCIPVEHFVEQCKCKRGEIVAKICMEEDVVHECGAVGAK